MHRPTRFCKLRNLMRLVALYKSVTVVMMPFLRVINVIFSKYLSKFESNMN